MNDGISIVPAPDTSDERLAALIQWTRKAGMPDVHALLQELQRGRAAVLPPARVAPHGPLGERAESCPQQIERIRQLESAMEQLEAWADQLYAHNTRRMRNTDNAND